MNEITTKYIWGETNTWRICIQQEIIRYWHPTAYWFQHISTIQCLRGTLRIPATQSRGHIFRVILSVVQLVFPWLPKQDTNWTQMQKCLNLMISHGYQCLYTFKPTKLNVDLPWRTWWGSKCSPRIVDRWCWTLREQGMSSWSCPESSEC